MAMMIPGTAFGALQATRKRVFRASAAHWPKISRADPELQTLGFPEPSSGYPFASVPSQVSISIGSSRVRSNRFTGASRSGYPISMARWTCLSSGIPSASRKIRGWRMTAACGQV